MASSDTNSVSSLKPTSLGPVRFRVTIETRQLVVVPDRVWKHLATEDGSARYGYVPNEEAREEHRELFRLESDHLDVRAVALAAIEGARNDIDGGLLRRQAAQAVREAIAYLRELGMKGLADGLEQATLHT